MPTTTRSRRQPIRLAFENLEGRQLLSGSARDHPGAVPLKSLPILGDHLPDLERPVAVPYATSTESLPLARVGDRAERKVYLVAGETVVLQIPNTIADKPVSGLFDVAISTQKSSQSQLIGVSDSRTPLLTQIAQGTTLRFVAPKEGFYRFQFAALDDNRGSTPDGENLLVNVRFYPAASQNLESMLKDASKSESEWPTWSDTSIPQFKIPTALIGSVTPAEYAHRLATANQKINNHLAHDSGQGINGLLNLRGPQLDPTALDNGINNAVYFLRGHDKQYGGSPGHEADNAALDAVSEYLHRINGQRRQVATAMDEYAKKLNANALDAVAYFRRQAETILSENPIPPPVVSLETSFDYRRAAASAVSGLISAGLTTIGPAGLIVSGIIGGSLTSAAAALSNSTKAKVATHDETAWLTMKLIANGLTTARTSEVKRSLNEFSLNAELRREAFSNPAVLDGFGRVSLLVDGVSAQLDTAVQNQVDVAFWKMLTHGFYRWQPVIQSDRAAGMAARSSLPSYLFVPSNPSLQARDATEAARLIKADPALIQSAQAALRQLATGDGTNLGAPTNLLARLTQKPFGQFHFSDLLTGPANLIGRFTRNPQSLGWTPRDVIFRDGGVADLSKLPLQATNPIESGGSRISPRFYTLNPTSAEVEATGDTYFYISQYTAREIPALLLTEYRLVGPGGLEIGSTTAKTLFGGDLVNLSPSVHSLPSGSHSLTYFGATRGTGAVTTPADVFFDWNLARDGNPNSLNHYFPKPVAFFDQNNVRTRGPSGPFTWNVKTIVGSR